MTYEEKKGRGEREYKASRESRERIERVVEIATPTCRFIKTGAKCRQGSQAHALARPHI